MEMNNVTFVIVTMSTVVFVSLLIGTVMKMWSYGIRNLKLLLSPVVIVAGFVIPGIMTKKILFSDIEPEISNITKNMSLFRKLRIWIAINFKLMRNYPEFIAVIAMFVSTVEITVRINVERQVEEAIEYSLPVFDMTKRLVFARDYAYNNRRAL